MHIEQTSTGKTELRKKVSPTCEAVGGWNRTFVSAKEWLTAVHSKREWCDDAMIRWFDEHNECAQARTAHIGEGLGNGATHGDGLGRLFSYARQTLLRGEHKAMTL